MIRFLTTFLLTILALQPLHAQTFPEPETVFVTDLADLIPADTELLISRQLENAKADRGFEMTVVTLPSLAEYSDQSIESYAKDLFNNWGVGDADHNDGVLLLVAREERETRIALGSGYPAVYDGYAAKIIRDDLRPNFSSGNFERGFLNAVSSSIDVFDLSEPPPAPVKEPLFGFQGDRIGDYIIPGFFALIAMIILRPWRWLMQAWQHFRPVYCPECRRRMTKLGNVQEKQHLDAGEILEEAMGNNAYNVWVCDIDGHITVKQTPGKRGRDARPCPKCNYRTLEIERQVHSAPSPQHAGKSRVRENCRNCDHKDSYENIIPVLAQNEDWQNGRRISTASSSGGSRGFGGGSSSGGGASGSW